MIFFLIFEFPLNKYEHRNVTKLYLGIQLLKYVRLN